MFVFYCVSAIFLTSIVRADIVLLKPIFIWFTHIAMSSIVMDKVNFLVSQLKKSVKRSLFRNKGFLMGSSAVQHLNPACRAARSVPHLSLARLLISLNDYDVPKAKHNRNLFGYIYETVFWLFVGLILLLSILPELVQEVIIKATVTVIVNLIYFAIFAGGDNIYVAFGVGTALFIGIFLIAGLLTRTWCA